MTKHTQNNPSDRLSFLVIPNSSLRLCSIESRNTVNVETLRDAVNTNLALFFAALVSGGDSATLRLDESR
jgi:hypothetical protein